MAIVVVLLFAVVVSRGCGSAGRELSADEAVAKAEEKAGWVPDKYQVRFLQQGIPPQPYWGVSLYDTGPGGRPTKVEVYLVNATTGEVKRQG